MTHQDITPLIFELCSYFLQLSQILSPNVREGSIDGNIGLSFSKPGLLNGFKGWGHIEKILMHKCVE